MKIFYMLTLPFLLAGELFGIYESKNVVLTDGSKVTYSVDEKKALNGPYTVDNAEGKLWLRGVYKDGDRSGNWYCFNSDGSVMLRYNYDLKKVVAIDDKMAAKIKFVLDNNDEKVAEKATVPVPICSIDQYVSLFNEQIYTTISREQKDLPVELPVSIVANINAKGAVSYKLIYDYRGMSYSSKLVIKERMYELQWAPSIYEGKIIPAEVTISSKLVTDPNKKQRFVWNY